MNRKVVDRIANAVLYEGYILYPYRPSVKNRQRWTFGDLYPEAHCRAQGGSDASSNQTQCLIQGGPGTAIEVIVRFLQLTNRQMDDQTCPVWQEAEEREVELPATPLADLTTRPVRQPFTFPGSQWIEPVRERQALEGIVELKACEIAEGLYRVTLTVTNLTALGDAGADRDKVVLRTMASTHTLLGVSDGEFVSLLDPPDCWLAEATACQNVGTWPVLVGADGQRDTILSSPIILYDYPQIAPESAGDFFDGTEIDEMLTLRVLTLTDEEKRAMTGIDGRTAALLARTEALAREQMAALHGTLRDLRPLAEEGAHD